jgi:hypothetical protein
MSLLVSSCLSTWSGYVHLLFCLQVPMDSLFQVRHDCMKVALLCCTDRSTSGANGNSSCVDHVTLLHHLHQCIQCPHLFLCLQTLTASGMPAATRPSGWLPKRREDGVRVHGVHDQDCHWHTAVPVRCELQYWIAWHCTFLHRST